MCVVNTTRRLRAEKIVVLVLLWMDWAGRGGIGTGGGTRASVVSRPWRLAQLSMRFGVLVSYSPLASSCD